MNINNIVGNAKEPNSLTEISDVTFENNRLVLRVENPITARKFGLSDNTYRYEFDGGTLYFYHSKDESEPSSFSVCCGRGGYTIVSNVLSRQIRSVKDEMSLQIVEKGMLEYFGNTKEFTSVAIELNNFFYTRDGSLRERKK